MQLERVLAVSWEEIVAHSVLSVRFEVGGYLGTTPAGVICDLSRENVH